MEPDLNASSFKYHEDAYRTHPRSYFTLAQTWRVSRPIRDPRITFSSHHYHKIFLLAHPCLLGFFVCLKECGWTYGSTRLATGSRQFWKNRLKTQVQSGAAGAWPHSAPDEPIFRPLLVEDLKKADIAFSPTFLPCSTIRNSRKALSANSMDLRRITQTILPLVQVPRASSSSL